ncbi:SET domain-containing protein [Plenodomus tracheiphilus IPT5]|uniref:SET domain-containing protein n=1 Tax=Plenodomus tracheiphilus IPT5 TaxID=1408161 RepID=A0A6A7B5U1_9PLEO|nr:SET domain-containing protein [Plenodomus tracheiphilus IPT5]
MGFGLILKQTWNKGDVLGVYLGELIPYRSYNTDYCHEVNIGPDFSGHSRKTGSTTAVEDTAYIDAGTHGNYARFCNHLCDNNANIVEARVGYERVLASITGRAIQVGEQVRDDYGEDYFHGRSCACGSLRCRYPAPLQGGDQDMML